MPAPDEGPDPYTVLPVDEEQKKNRTAISRILLRGQFEGAEQEGFDRYYQNYLLPRWSLRQHRAELAEFRKELESNLRTCGTGDKPRAIHDHLNELALKYLNEKLVKDPQIRPAARVNAVLMLGALNQTESAAAAEPPVPLQAALVELVRAAASKNQLDAVRVAAMCGILRHARLNAIPPGSNTRAVVTQVMLSILDAGRPKGKGAAGDAWLRAQAAEVLGLFGEVGNQNAVVLALQKQVADRSLPFAARLTAVDAIGKLNYNMVTRLDVAALVQAICVFVVNAIDAEIDAAGEEKPVSRARLKERLIAAAGALDKAGKVSGAPATVPGLQQALTKMVQAIEDRRLEDSKVLQTAADDAAPFRAQVPAEPGKPAAPRAAPADALPAPPPAPARAPVPAPPGKAAR
jgi:hypothetical protein